MPAHIITDTHIGHGSHVAYMTWPDRSSVFSFLHASRTATISA